MSLSRAFTTRRLKLNNESSDSILPRRSNTTKVAPELRAKISAPVQLLHTTNMLSYNAPDLPRQSRSNSASKSEDDTDSLTTADSTPPTSPDVSASERCNSPEPNHLSCYFTTSGKVSSSTDFSAPTIPKRSPSHTKKSSFEALARKSSTSRVSRESEHSVSSKGTPSFSRTASISTRASSASHPSTPVTQKQEASVATVPTRPQRSSKEQHPFGQELAQVTELAEEYGGNRQLKAAKGEEEVYLEKRGLVKLSADDYLGAIHGLSSVFFPERNHAKPSTPLWI